jgi:hypothetical protein
MFKILVLQTMYNLSDEQTQFQIMDRMTFKRFLGLKPEESIPDQKTIWLFRDILAKAGTIKKLFDLFQRHLDEAVNDCVNMYQKRLRENVPPPATLSGLWFSLLPDFAFEAERVALDVDDHGVV